MTSSMHGIPEPIHLYAQPKPPTAPYLVTHVTSHAVASTAPEAPLQVVRSSGEMVVPLTNSADFVKDTIAALRMMGVDHESSVITRNPLQAAAAALSVLGWGPRVLLQFTLPSQL
jgi:hypothetical protein